MKITLSVNFFYLLDTLLGFLYQFLFQQISESVSSTWLFPKTVVTNGREEVVYKKRFFKCRKTQWEISVPESLFNKVADLQATLLKREFETALSANFARFFRKCFHGTPVKDCFCCRMISLNALSLNTEAYSETSPAVSYFPPKSSILDALLGSKHASEYRSVIFFSGWPVFRTYNKTCNDNCPQGFSLPFYSCIF